MGKNLKSVLYPLLFLCGILVGGCEDQAADSSVKSETQQLPLDLKKMQGQWIGVGESGELICEARINNYTIRISCTEDDRDSSWKRNACIQSVDTVNNSLLIYGDKLAWQYVFRSGGEDEQLILRFYDVEMGKWRVMGMKRAGAFRKAVASK
jgi:hypothetical protein